MTQEKSTDKARRFVLWGTLELHNIKWVSGQNQSEGIYGKIQAMINSIEQQNNKQENSQVMLQD